MTATEVLKSMQQLCEALDERGETFLAIAARGGRDALADAIQENATIGAERENALNELVTLKVRFNLEVASHASTLATYDRLCDEIRKLKEREGANLTTMREECAKEADQFREGHTAAGMKAACAEGIALAIRATALEQDPRDAEIARLTEALKKVADSVSQHAEPVKTVQAMFFIARAALTPTATPPGEARDGAR